MRKLFVRLLKEWKRRIEEKTAAPMSEKEINEIKDAIYGLMGTEDVETFKEK